MLPPDVSPEIKERREAPLLCPSAQPDMEGSRVFGVVGGTTDCPEVSYLDRALDSSTGLPPLPAFLKATEVFRFAAHCEENACQHFDGSRCKLATRIIQILPVVADALPACVIRPHCRWYQQEARAACLRCPQVVTQIYGASEDMRRAAEGHACSDGGHP